jgi:hypothetical protein
VKEIHLIINDEGTPRDVLLRKDTLLSGKRR